MSPSPTTEVAAQRVAVVTGGGRGIGAAVALALGRAGLAVCVNDTGVRLDGTQPDDQVAAEVAAGIRAAGGQAMAVGTDARQADAARALVGAVEDWAGQAPTVLVHAAGTLRDGMAHKASDEDWDEIIGAHLDVAIQLCRAMARPIRTAGWGRVVLVGGAAGLVGSVGQAAYDVAKAGLFGLTRALALELAGIDACVNYVAPFAFTRMTESIPPRTETLRRYLEHAAAATADDVAPLLAWLCSEAASGITGQVIGARGAEVTLWSQPRPVAAMIERRGWDAAALTAARERMEPHLVALESEFDLFGGPPVPVERDFPAAASAVPGDNL
jgi:NAD(P)-dependent dehydrogenase (short-subunit alcohol dehydrogenase family)